MLGHFQANNNTVLNEQNMIDNKRVSQLETLGTLTLHKNEIKSYINKVKETIVSEPDALHFKSEISQPNRFLILQTVTRFDPIEYKEQRCSGLNTELDNFLNQKEDGLFIISGESGSGKSLAMQSKFFNVIRTLDETKRETILPVYIDFGVESEFIKNIIIINQKLNVNIALFNHLEEIQLYIDNYDENSQLWEKGSESLANYLSFLGKFKLRKKIIITCGSRYISYKDDPCLFDVPGFKTIVWFITPLDFSASTVAYEDLIFEWIKKQKLRNNEEADEKFLEKIRDEILRKIIFLGLKPDLKFGLKFQIIMQLLYETPNSDIQTLVKNRNNILSLYITKYVFQKIQNLTQETKERLKQFLINNILFTGDLQDSIEQLGEIIVRRILEKGTSKIALKPDNIIQHYTIQNSEDFTCALRLLPLSIEERKVSQDGFGIIGFKHDSFRYYFLLRALKRDLSSSLRTNTDSKAYPFENDKTYNLKTILSNKSLKTDFDFITYLQADFNENFIDSLREVINQTKLQTRTDNDVIAAANAMTILVALNYNFSGQDLSNVSVRGANMTGGLFNITNFSGADLRGVILDQAYLAGAIFYETDLSDVLLGEYPQIKEDDKITSVGFSPDGKKIVTTSDECINIYSVDKAKSIKKISGLKSLVLSSCFTSDSRKFITTDENGLIKIWDSENGNCLAIMKDNNMSGNSVCITRDGKTIISAHDDYQIKFWNAVSCKFLKNLQNHTAQVTSVNLSSDEKRLVSASQDKTIVVWDLKTSQSLHQLKGHLGGVNEARFSPDGNLIVSAGDDCQVILWDSRIGESLMVIKGHTHRVKTASFSPNGKRIASGSEDKLLKIWDVETGFCLKSIEIHRNTILSVCFNYDGTLLASGGNDRYLRIHHTRAPQAFFTSSGHDMSVKCVCISPDSTVVVSGSEDRKLKVWQTSSGALLKTLEGHGSHIFACAFSPNGKIVATGSEDRRIILWDIESGKIIKKLERHDERVLSVCFTHDGRYVLSSSIDTKIKIWDWEKGTCAKTLNGHEDSVMTMLLMPDGKTLFTGDGRGIVKEWNIYNGSCISTIEAHSQIVFSISNCNYNNLIATGSYDTTVKIWDLPDWNEVKTLECHSVGVVKVIFFDKGTKLATAGDNLIKIWDVSSGRVLSCLSGHVRVVWDICLSSDERILISGGLDQSLRIWEAQKIEYNSEGPIEVFKEYEGFVLKHFNGKSPRTFHCYGAIIYNSNISQRNRSIFELFQAGKIYDKGDIIDKVFLSMEEPKAKINDDIDNMLLKKKPKNYCPPCKCEIF